MGDLADVATRTVELEGVGGPLAGELFAAAVDNAPLVGVMPALGIGASYYRGFAAHLAALGVDVFLADLPGVGASKLRARRGVDWSYRDCVETQATAIAGAARALRPDAEFFWLGHSLGGQIALMHSGFDPDTVSGVVLICSGTPYFRSWSGMGRARILAGTQVSSAIARLLGYYPGDKLGFGGIQGKTLIRNWAKVARSGRYDFDGFDGEALVARCTCPILSLRLEGDDLAPQTAIDHAIEKTSAHDVTRESWAASSPAIDHNRWPRDGARPAEIVHNWLRERVAP